MQEYAKHIAGGMLSTFEEYLQGKTCYIVKPCREMYAKVLKKGFEKVSLSLTN